MRRIIQLSAACLVAGALSACSNPEQVKNTPDIPTAGVRFINAVPDTGGSGGLDFRYVDIVDNNNAQYAIQFRNNLTTSGAGAALIPASTQIEYKAVQAGNRHFKIFLDDTLTTVAQTVLKDSTMTVEDGHRYTVLLWGNARTGVSPAMQLKIIDETYDPNTSVGIRIINTTTQTIDVREYSSSGSLPSSPTFSGVPGMSISNYLNVAPDTMRFNVQPAGGGTALFSDVRALVGTSIGTKANGCTVGLDCDATPGSTAAGTALTAIIFPASVAGSKAPQSTAFKSPAISFMWDKRPARASGT